MNSLAIAVRDFIISAGNWFGKFLDLGGQAFINVVGDIIMLVGTILAEVMRDAINFITAFMNSWAGSVIIGAVALTLNIVAGAIKAVLIVIEQCRYVLEAFLILWGAWKFKHVIEGAMLGTNALGKFLEKIVMLSRNIISNTIEFGIWAKNLLTSCIGAIKNLGNAILTNATAKIITLSSKIRTSTREFIIWAKNILLHPVTSMGKLCGGIKTLILGLKAQAKELLVNIGNWIKDTAGKVANTIATKAQTVATSGATMAQLALNLAMDACPILLLVSLIAGLVIAVKKIGDKFGWWKAIMEAISPVIDWVKEKLGWLWDKIAGFFGWDTEPEVKENIEEVGTVAEETAKTTDDAFGTATSNVNRYLDSIHFNATKLAQEVDEATKTATEKFGMLSQSATEYLDAIKNHNTEKLAEMGENQSIYNEEVKAMYADLTEAEKNEFMKQYGILQGINDDMLNYEGLKYDDRVARHAAYLATIEADESLSYQDKKAKMDQANAEFQASIDSEVAKYQESIASKQSALDQLLSTHGNTTAQGRMYEQELRDAIDEDRAHIDEITKTSYDNQVTTVEGATDAMAQANQDSATAQEDAYKNVATTAEESMATVNKSIGGARKNIQTFTNEATALATQLKNSFNGVGSKISSEFNMASSSISTTLSKIQAMVRNTTSSIKSSIASAFSNISSIISSNMSQCSNIIRTTFANMSSTVRSSLSGISQTTASMFNTMISIYRSASANIANITSNLVTLMSKGFQSIRVSSNSTFLNIKNNITNNMNEAYRNVANCISKIRALFNNFNATLRVKVPHFYMYGDFNLQTKEVPKVGVNYFAKGGIVDRATLGIVGEAGKEAIMPLENNTGWITDLAQKVANRMPQSDSSGFGDGDLILQVDGSVIGKVALKQLRKMQRQGNITLIPT